MKIYAKGCDAPPCANEAEVDRNLGRPVGWYFVTVEGPVPAPGSAQPSGRKTIVLCAACYHNLKLVLP